jgi:hypothetical protein
MRMLFASRPMVELTIRKFVADDRAIRLVEGTRL